MIFTREARTFWLLPLCQPLEDLKNTSGCGNHFQEAWKHVFLLMSHNRTFMHYYIGVKIHFFFCSSIFPLPSIFSALLEDSEKVSFQQGFVRYLFAILSTCATSQNFYDLTLSRVPVQGVNILVVLGEIPIDIKNIRHIMTSVTDRK